MRLRIVVSALLALSPVLLHAQAATGVRAGEMIVTSDGKSVGRVERVVSDAGGAPASAAVIFDDRFIYIPASTLTADQGSRLKTSLSIKDVRALR